MSYDKQRIAHLLKDPTRPFQDRHGPPWVCDGGIYWHHIYIPVLCYLARGVTDMMVQVFYNNSNDFHVANCDVNGEHYYRNILEVPIIEGHVKSLLIKHFS